MQITKHITIDITPNNGSLDIELKASGKLKHGDYTIMIPMLKQALKSMPNPKVNMLIDATEFQGWELEAVWDDFKFGIEYKDVFLKIAIVGTEKWQEYLTKIGSWFMHGKVKFFYDLNEAKVWIK